MTLEELSAKETFTEKEAQLIMLIIRLDEDGTVLPQILELMAELGIEN